jgi:hypothetical protein
MKKGSLLRTLLTAVLISALTAGVCCVVYVYRDTLRDWLSRQLARALELIDRLKAALVRPDDDFADL